jgi:D-serine deaminase-like pyridoxal phosphate-dependent protein
MLLPDILTPTLLLDEAVCRRNIARMRIKSSEHGLLFRPHFKTHQSRRVASWFRDEGVTAITVSSVGMAHYFADDGWTDITIAFPVNIRQSAEISALAERVSLGVLLESPSVARRLSGLLSAPVRAWIKVDTGYGRTGIPHADRDALLMTALAIESASHLTLAGILTHGGDTYQSPTPEDARRRFSASRLRLLAAAEALLRRYPGLLVSVGDTPGCVVSDDFGGIDEIRPGNFVFFDAMQLQHGICRIEDIGVALACPVVAVHPQRNEVVLYGGAVHLSREGLADANGTQIFGLVARLREDGWDAPHPGATVVRLSQEHGIAHLPANMFASIEEGDLLAVLPVHSCLTAECMKRYRSLDGTDADHFAAGSAAIIKTPSSEYPIL